MESGLAVGERVSGRAVDLRNLHVHQPLQLPLLVCESGRLRAVHLSRHKWPGRLVN